MISQTVEYALRAMVHLASLPSQQAVNSETIAASTQVPQGYLSKVLRDLVLAELVTSQRGPSGGFMLARPPGDISMLDVVNAVDAIPRIKRCPLNNPAHLRLCPLHQRIDDALDLIEQQFRDCSLLEVLQGANREPGQCSSFVAPTVRRKKA